MKILYWFAFLVLVVASACSRPTKQGEKEIIEHQKLSYAKEFAVSKSKKGTELTIYLSSKDKQHKANFTLVPSTEKGNETTIPVPCKKIMCLSSTQLAYFFALDDIDNIVALNSSRFLKHKGMRQRIERGEAKQIGKEGNFNLELIAAINPDVIFVSPFKSGGFDALRNLGIPLVPMAAYSENTPLGRAEWIKMMALFCGKEQEADSIFTSIEKRYTDLKARTANVDNRPTVFSGKLRSGSWYVPGGNSFYAHYFRDAGADYIIKDKKQGAYPLDFESIYSKAAKCDYWRLVHPEKKGLTLAEFGEQDSRYTDFKAFREKNVLLCNIRQKPYYEEAAVKPDVILSDYIHFFHPELLPNYTPYFYDRLQ